MAVKFNYCIKCLRMTDWDWDESIKKWVCRGCGSLMG